jgi:hypothetical protein
MTALKETGGLVQPFTFTAEGSAVIETLCAVEATFPAKTKRPTKIGWSNGNFIIKLLNMRGM